MKVPQVFRRVRRFASLLWHDTSGVMLPYVTALLVIIVGVSLLAFDGAGRAFSLQTQLQNIADAAALAGAAELNRAPGARTRATNAITNLVTNRLAGMDVTNVTLSTPVYYETLPAASTYFSSGTVSPDDGHARFVAVTLSHTMNTIFPASFLRPGAANSYTAGAQAVAGSDSVSCQDTPMFICNPFETPSMTYDQATAALQNASTRTLVALQGASNSQYAPGNFGWIEPSVQGTASNTCGSGNAVAQAAARTQPPACFRASTINTQPGDIANATDGLNTRFDIYNGSFGSCKGNSNYPPAPNVRKGYLPGNGSNGACNPSPVTGVNNNLYPAGDIQAMGFPLDRNMLNADGTPNTSATVPSPGDGNWPCGDTGLTTSAATTTAASGSCTGNGRNFTPSPACILHFTSTVGIYAGMGVTNSVPSGTYVLSKTTNTVLLSQKVSANVSSGATITFVGYWKTAHPTGQPGAGNPPAGCTAPATISRESVYKYEIANNYLNSASLGGEVGGPTCSTSTPNSNRRYVNAAVLNCHNLESEGYSLNGSATNLPVAAIAKFFLTLPVVSSSSAIYAEYVGIVPPVGGGASANNELRLQVQLYR